MTIVIDAGTLRDRVSAALRHEWDPIGVGAIAEARDEYDAYADVLAGLVRRRAPPSEIFDYLWAVETEDMGLTGDAVATRRFAEEVSFLPTATE